jgi:hypothetical protein
MIAGVLAGGLAREGIRRRADFVGAHRVLTAAGMAGRGHVARLALQEVRRAARRSPGSPIALAGTH